LYIAANPLKRALFRIERSSG